MSPRFDGAEMTSPQPGTAVGRLLGGPMPADRARGWLVAAVITLLGGLIRFQNLGSPTDPGPTPVFDEKYYALQGWQVLRNAWIEDNPGFNWTVHPPLGKQLIALGELLFGYTGWGWRFASAVAGALMVLLLVRTARRLTRSTLLGALAGVLLICDGVAHVMSRMAMLDIFLALFVLAAFGCVLLDRDHMRGRLATAMREGWATASPFGPRLGFRWWRFGAGVCLGLACAVKWGGLYWIAAFGLLTVFWDVTARRAAGIARPWAGALRRDLLPALGSLLLLPVLLYLGSWWSWFASETGVNRHLAGTALSSLWQYTADVYHFHQNLVTPKDKPHPWESKPWSWPMGLRPMLYFIDTSVTGAAGCGASSCVRATMLIGTPALWWLAFPMIGWGLWRWLGTLDWRYGAVLVTYLAGLLPWFLNLDRQMYFFYMTPLSAFLVLGLVLPLGEVLGSARAGAERRGTGLLVVALYTGLVVANFVWLWPILNGDPITQSRWQAELWLPSWR